MLGQYGHLLRTPGAGLFLLGSSLARIGSTMFGIGVVTMVSGRTGSYGLAGALAGVGLVVLALTVAPIGRLVDRLGQGRITRIVALHSAFWSVVLVALSATGAPQWTLFVAYPLSLILGNPSTLSRARWSHVLRKDPAGLHTAMSFEQVLDELGFVIGPALAAFAGVTLFPEAGIVLATTFFTAGSLIFCAARRTEPPVLEPSGGSGAAVLRNPAILTLMAMLTMTGVIFGANEVSTIAVAQEHDAKSAGGVIIALFALGSAASAVFFGTRNLSMPLHRALIAGAAGMAVLEAPVLLVADLVPLGLVLLIAGVATAPTLIVVTAITRQLVPASRLNEAMGVVFTGLVVGVALGSAVSGYLAEEHGGSRGYLAAVVAGALAVVLAVVGRRAIASRLAGPT